MESELEQAPQSASHRKYPHIGEVEWGEIIVVWLDTPGERVNKLSITILEEFGSLLKEIDNDSEAIGVVLMSRKRDSFIVGGDLAEIRKLEAKKASFLSQLANQLLIQLSHLTKPVVAAIHGPALGGGLELALACHYRIASDSSCTRFGLPEVKVGLIPAGGGTQRLPRLIGVRRALNLILTGRTIASSHARNIGLVDELVYPEKLLLAARQTALKLNGQKALRRKKHSPWLDRLLESNKLGRRLLYRKARKQIQEETRGCYPAPILALDCVRVGLEENFTKGLETEGHYFQKLISTPQAQELIQLFFSMRAARKNPESTRPRTVETIGVLGAGLMGSGISLTSIESGFDLILKDESREALAAAEQMAWQRLSKKHAEKVLTDFQRDRTLSRLFVTSKYDHFSRARLVIEAVNEDLDLKRRVIGELEPFLSPATVIASNTSSIPIAQLSSAATRPERVIGMHYFSPVLRMPLVEIIQTPETEKWVVSTACNVALRQGKHVIVVNDAPGFFTTRILAAFLNEALVLLEEGARVDRVDEAMRNFGFPIGPLALLDSVGLGVAAHVADTLAGLFASRGYTPTNAAERLFKSGYRGRQNGRGFYRHDRKRKKASVNQAVYAFFGGSSRKEFETNEIQERLTLQMVNEATYCLEQEVISCPGDGDLGAVLGLGFPPFLGGPFRYIDRKGAGEVVQRLEQLVQKEGTRFTPSDLLQQRAKSGKRFYLS